MSTSYRQAHWDTIYATKDEATLSWFQEKLEISMQWISRESPLADAAIIDVGGGTSRLAHSPLRRE